MLNVVKLADESSRFGSNSYLLMTDTHISVIDPSVSYQTALSSVREISNLKSGFVILTHGHCDHIWEIESYVRVGFRVLVNLSDAEMLSDAYLNCSANLFRNPYKYSGKYETVQDGQIIDIFGASLRVLSTPGHTAGSVCYVGDGIAFTGDTLFANGGYGRYDLPTGNAEKLVSSLKKLFELDENITIYPGHGSCSTLKQTKSFF